MLEEITKFDKYLASKGLKFETVIIGGAALLVLGIINRATRDVDCLDPHIPNNIKEASIEFSKVNNLDSDWLNNGPELLKDDLPEDWIDRVTLIFEGDALKLFTLGRIDLLRSKLYAYCDRQQDLQDCIALEPTDCELDEIKPWLYERDGNPDWKEHIDRSILFLRKELGYVS